MTPTHVRGGQSAVLDDWIEMRRPDATDEYGRKPLIASKQGRVHTTTLRSDCYRFTRPCAIKEECPHDYDSETCVAASYDNASACPSSVSPHAFRRGGITYTLNNDWPRPAVSDRANI